MEARLIPAIVAIFFFTSGLALGVAYLAWKRRKKLGNATLALLMIAIAAWALCDALEIAANGLPLKVLLGKFGYFGRFAGTALFLLFALEFAGMKKWLTTPRKLALLLLPALSLVMVFTTEIHRLTWSSYSLNQETNTVVYEHGIFWWFQLIYVYIYLVSATVLFVVTALRLRHLFQLQATVMIIGFIFPIAANLIYVSGLSPIPGVDLASLGFTITGMIMLWSMTRLRLMDLTPIARDLLIENMRDGLLVLDSENRIVDYNQAARVLLAWVKPDVVGQPAEQVLAFWPELWTYCRSNSQVRAEILLKSEPPRHLELNITLIQTPDGNVMGRLLILRDITQRKLAEEAEKEQRSLADALRATAETLGSSLDINAVLDQILDQIGRVVPWDAAVLYLVEEGQTRAARWQHKGSRAEIPASLLSDRTHLAMLSAAPLVISRQGAGSEWFRQPSQAWIQSAAIVPIQARGEVIGYLEVDSAGSIHYEEKHTVWLAAFAAQAAVAIENARLFTRTEQLALTDSLTGLWNRRKILQTAEAEFERARRYGPPVAVAMIDMDLFKEINDTYGHAAGDHLLIEFARLCRQEMRQSDALGRYGGDEFLFVLPGADCDHAIQFMERMRRIITETPIHYQHNTIPVLFSAGIASSQPDFESLHDLIHEADRALYAAKSGGRNQIRCARDL